MSIDKISENLKIYAKYIDNLKNDRNHLPTNQAINAVSALNMEKVNNLGLSNLMKVLANEENQEERLKDIETFINDEITKRKGKKEELISNIYGVDITNIEHKILENGKEIFAFEDQKIGRKRIIENSSEESLAKQLKEKQTQNIKYQTDNNEENAIEILNDDSYEKKSEYDMIYIGDLGKYRHLLNKLNPEQLNNYNELLSKVISLNIKYIDIINQIALDKDGNIYEAYYDKLEGKSKVEMPNEYRYSENEMSNQEKAEEKVESFNEDGKLESYNFEEEKQNFEEELNDEYIGAVDENIANMIKQESVAYYSGNVNVKRIYVNIIKFYKHPEKMNDLVGKRKEFYEKMVKKYEEIINQKQEAQKEMRNEPKKLTYKNPDAMAGYVNIILVSLITIVILLILGIIYRIN